MPISRPLSIAVLVSAACAQSSSGHGTPSGGEPDAGGGTTASGGASSSGTIGGSGQLDDAAADGGSGGGSGGGGAMGSASSGSSGSGTGSSSGSQSDGSGSGSGAMGPADASSDSKTGASTCTSANAVCHASNSGCNVGSYYLYDNQWNCGPSSNCGSGRCQCGPESAYGCTGSNGTVAFVVTSNQPTGNTAVLSYPAVQDNFSSNPLLSSFTAITATFEETSPHVGDYEVAWDCWFNNQANELMIWVDNYNQSPAGNKVATNVMLGGRSYDVWWNPSSGGGGYVVFYANTTFTSGTVDLLNIFNYAASHSWLGTNPTVGQLSFGVEVCSTGGQSATWSFNDYSITTSP